MDGKIYKYDKIANNYFEKYDEKIKLKDKENKEKYFFLKKRIVNFINNNEEKKFLEKKIK